MGGLALVGDHSTVLLTRILCKTIFFKCQNPCKARTPCIRIDHPGCTCMVAFHTMYALCHSSLSYYGDGLWVSGGATIWENNFRIPLHSFLSALNSLHSSETSSVFFYYSELSLSYHATLIMGFCNLFLIDIL